MQIFAGVSWGGGVIASNESCGRWKWRFSLHSFTVFRTFYIHGQLATRQLSRDVTVDDLGDISRPLDCFTSNFSKTVRDTAKVRPLIGNHTLAFDWCHLWWLWSTFEGHFSLVCHFHVHFSNPWLAFASHSLPTIAELLIRTTVHKIARPGIAKPTPSITKMSLHVFMSLDFISWRVKNYEGVCCRLRKIYTLTVDENRVTQQDL